MAIISKIFFPNYYFLSFVHFFLNVENCYLFLDHSLCFSFYLLLQFVLI